MEMLGLAELGHTYSATRPVSPVCLLKLKDKPSRWPSSGSVAIPLDVSVKLLEGLRSTARASHATVE